MGRVKIDGAIGLLDYWVIDPKHRIIYFSGKL